jgi:molybdopterin biosynthesis enzyme
MTHFLPARLAWTEGPWRDAGSHARKPDALPARTLPGKVYPLRWQGSGDIAAMVQANCFLVVDAELSNVAAGTRMPVLLRKDVV